MYAVAVIYFWFSQMYSGDQGCKYFSTSTSTNMSLELEFLVGGIFNFHQKRTATRKTIRGMYYVHAAIYIE